jgi:hypothetical protein
MPQTPERRREYYLQNRDTHINAARRWRANNLEYVRAVSKNTHERYSKLVESPRHGRYTPAEDAVITDESISNIEKAIRLQRTYQSVQQRRAYLRKQQAK